MLHQLLVHSREKIIARTREKIATRALSHASEVDLPHGVPLFLTQLVGMLEAPSPSSKEAIAKSATRHGEELLGLGVSVEEVVRDYGGLCQSITEIAVEDDIPISASDFKVLNLCLDDAIAAAVAEFGRRREAALSDDGVKHLGVLAHEMLNALHVAIFAFDAIRTGTVGVSGTTGTTLARNLDRMREIVERSVAEVRRKSGIHERTEVSVETLMAELSSTGEVEAQQRGLQLVVEPGAGDVNIAADRHLLTSALTNLLQNAFKFTRPHSRVSLRTVATADRVRIEVEDQCGGLPPGKVQDLFRLCEQRGTDRSGIGFGLAISREAVEANGGTIDVRDLPGHGCVFSVELPRAAVVAAPPQVRRAGNGRMDAA